jgi:hypothetical protein
MELIKVLSQNLFWVTEERHSTPSVGITSVPKRIQTRHLPNMRQKPCRCIEPFATSDKDLSDGSTFFLLGCDKEIIQTKLCVHSSVQLLVSCIQGVPGGHSSSYSKQKRWICTCVLFRTVSDIELFHCTVHCTLYRRATRHVLTRVAKCIDLDGGIFENVLN